MATLNTSDGSFVYTPAMGYVGADAFTYTLTNSVGNSTGTVALTVNGTAPATVNDGPYTVTTGTTLTVNAATGVLTNDTKGTPTATITANTQPAHGRRCSTPLMVALSTRPRRAIRAVTPSRTP